MEFTAEGDIHGLEPGGAKEKESMILPITEGDLLKEEGLESPRIDAREDSQVIIGVSNLQDEEEPETESEEVLKSIDESTQLVDVKEFRKHIFIFSEAGKPIYSRHGSEEQFVTTMGVMQALCSCVQDRNQDQIRYIIAGKHRFVYLLRLPLILVGVSCDPWLTCQQLQNHLLYMYNEVIRSLTQATLSKVFESRSNFDLRNMLAGSEKFFHALSDRMDVDPCFLMGAVRCLPLTFAQRDQITQAIVQSCAKVKDLIFAILVADNHLVTMGRMKKFQLHPVDLHLILNQVESSQRLKTGENWFPICLPKFNASAFLQAYVSYLDEGCVSCLLFITTQREQSNFFQLKECRSKIVDRLNKHNSLKVIADSIKGAGYSVKETGIFELRHFIYKAKSSAQLTSPRYEGLYLQEENQRRLIGLYHTLHNRIFNPGRPLKILYWAGPRETQLGWHLVGLELFATFEPFITKENANRAMKKLINWIKKDEDRLFIMNSATF